MLLGDFRTSSRNIIGRNPSMVIPLLANQDLTPVLAYARLEIAALVTSGGLPMKIIIR